MRQVKNVFIGCSPMLSDDGIASCGLYSYIRNIHYTRSARFTFRSLTSLNQPTKIMAKQEKFFAKTVKNVIPP